MGLVHALHAPSRPPAAQPVDVTRRLLAFLLSGTIQVGQRIPPERKLALDLGVGRSVVREALGSLALLGLIEIRQGDGTYLRQPDSPLLSEALEWGLRLGIRRTYDLVEARQIIEVDLAGLAAERRDDADIEDLRKLLRRMDVARSRPTLVHADIAFHLRIAQAARNEVLADLLEGISALMSVWMHQVFSHDHDPDLDREEHRELLAAIEAGDPVTARDVMRVKLERGAQELRDALDVEALPRAKRRQRPAGVGAASSATISVPRLPSGGRKAGSTRRS